MMLRPSTGRRYGPLPGQRNYASDCTGRDVRYIVADLRNVDFLDSASLVEREDVARGVLGERRSSAILSAMRHECRTDIPDYRHAAHGLQTVLVERGSALCACAART